MVRLRPSLTLLTLILLLVSAAPLRAQEIAPVGTDAALDVATWNIEWFGSSGANQGPSDVQRQFEAVRTIIEQSGIDIWGVQEISNPTLFHALIDSLGDGYGGSLATYAQQQKIGFIYRTAVVQPVTTPRHILTQYFDEFAGRPPLEMSVEVTLPDTSFEATVITLHMKAMSDVSSYNSRVEASRRLKNQLDFLYATDAVFVLGDFNDRLTTSITFARDTPYQNFLDDEATYRFVTLEAEERGGVSFIGSSLRSMIDHILISNELFDAYAEDTARPWSELTTTFFNYDQTVFVTDISDHLPVIANFDITTGTSAELSESNWAMSLSAPHPNPATGHAAISYVIEQGSEVIVEMFDITGRRIATIEDRYRTPGRHEAKWSVAGLAPGMYLVRLTAGKRVETQALAVIGR